MFKKPIVLVVGAGASFDKYNLPLGGKLAAGIARDTDFYWDDSRLGNGPSRGSRELFEHFFFSKFAGSGMNTVLPAAQKLSRAIASTISIDDALFLLSEQPDCVSVGKLCIMRAILMAEATSSLRVEPGGLGHNAGRDGWIEQIFSMAITGLKVSQIAENAFKNITFVIFNYDRCIEHYLYWSLRRLEIPAADARTAIESLNIIRPYGGLGSIFRDSKEHLDFGAEPRKDLWDHIGRIRTFTDSEVLHDPQKLSEAWATAQMVIFLGFGFHPQNMSLLAKHNLQNRRATRTLSTTIGVHPSIIPELRTALANLVMTDEGKVEPHDMTASTILTDLRWKITAAVG